MYSLNIIGAGRCGKALGLLLKYTQKVHIQGICNQHQQSSQASIDLIGEGKAFKRISDLPPADLTLISVPDDAIEKCAVELSLSPHVQPTGIVFHCSGSLTSDVLLHLKHKGYSTASIHPLRSFADSSKSVAFFSGCYCALEGDMDACEILQSLFFEMGAHVFPLNPSHKKRYHAGAVFASNYLVTLAKTTQSLMVDCGIDEDSSKHMILSLMSSCLENIKNHDTIEESLTGPIRRGDIETLKSHLGVLTDASVDNLYRALGMETLKITDLDKNTKHQIKNILLKKSEF